jgi:cytochrome P450 family 142 subfamily A polypeptide 1
MNHPGKGLRQGAELRPSRTGCLLDWELEAESRKSKAEPSPGKRNYRSVDSDHPLKIRKHHIQLLTLGFQLSAAGAARHRGAARDSHIMQPSSHRSIDLLDRNLYEGDPEPTYAWLRSHAPVYWDETNQLWGISRYADIVAISRDTKLFSSAQGSRPNLPGDESMINQDDPRHQALRRIFARDITPRGAQRFEALVRRITAELLDAVASRGKCDVVGDLAVPLPVRLIVDVLGFDSTQWRRYAEWAQVTMAAGGGPRYVTEEAMLAAVEFFDHARQVLEARRTSPKDDWLSLMLARAEEGPAARDTDALASECLLILDGGSDTTRHVIAGGTLALLDNPGQLEMLVRQPERISTAVEEMVRWVTPILNMRRTATRDTELHGQKIRKGDQLLLMYASANRDERVFENPNRFDVARNPNPHIAFGIGAHFCLGANLARMELRVMFEQMLSRMRGLRRADERAPRYVATAFARGLASLPVEFDAA